MIEKINGIKNSKHPYSEEINKTIALLDKIFNVLLVIINSVGFIAAIIASAGLAEWADGISGGVADVPVNFFGYFIELESDTFGGSPFVVFLHTTIILVLISLVIFCVKTIITTMLYSKAKMLDSLYHSEKLTELLIVNGYSSKVESSARQET